MKQRIISAIFMAPMFVLLYIGGIPLFVFCIAISILGQRELYNAFECLSFHADKIIGIVFGISFSVLLFMISRGIISSEKSSYVITSFVFLLTIYSVSRALYDEDHDIFRGVVTLPGVFYPAFFFVHIWMISDLGPEFSPFTGLVFVCAFGTDIFAYFSGIAFGKHKLCPKLSPKKTVEGSIGGIAGSVVFSILYGIIFFKEYLIHCVVIGIAGSVLSQLGDLSASAVKRKAGIKDYSNLIPGHGGILDRFDSVAFAAPFIYYYILFVVL